MEKLVRFLIPLLFLFPGFAPALTLKYRGETSIEFKSKFRDTRIGGLSALAYHEGKLWALSDDKGRDGEPRFYVFGLKIDHAKIHLKPEEVFPLTHLPSRKGEVSYVDAEAMVRLPSGDLLISSENNNDRKPRVQPRLFRVSAEGVFKCDLSWPENFLPEALGLQKKGLQNNAGFEGLSLSADGKFLFAMAEAPILTDLPEVNSENQDQWIRLVKFETGSAGEFEARAQYAYKLESLSKTAGGQEIFRGVSEALALNEKKILVMERGVRLQKSGWNQSVALYEADLENAADISKVKNLSLEKNLKSMAKKKILDFEEDLKKERPKKEVQNYEGLAWGPPVEGKKTLLVISDDNFSKKEKTELLVFTVESE